jgi:uncharacterized membrane protein YvbJ
MVCNNCGRTMYNEQAKFCEYCGQKLVSEQEPVNPILPRTVTVIEEEQEKPVSLGNWLGSLALMFIPFVGGLVFFIMLFVWAFAGYVPQSKKNWARAMLIIAGIVLVLAIILVIIGLSSARFLGGLDFDFDIQDYLNDFKFNY